jgi:hypothetical protein
MNSVTLNAERGRSLQLTQAQDVDSEHGSGFNARLTIPEGAVETNVYEYRESLAEYFSDLAAQWRGWDGVNEYASLEGQLSLSATHDRLGTVTISIALRQPWPPDWSFEAELEFGSGAHLEAIARDVAAFQG